MLDATNMFHFVLVYRFYEHSCDAAHPGYIFRSMIKHHLPFSSLMTVTYPKLEAIPDSGDSYHDAGRFEDSYMLGY